MTIDNLPLEIQVKILQLVPQSSLKLTSSHFYLLYNDLFYDKLLRTFGDDVIVILMKVYTQLREYMKSLDSFRLESRLVASNRLNLTDLGKLAPINPTQLLRSVYVKDSWRYIYSLLKNKRLFAEYSDYKIDQPTNYIYNHYVEINRTYLLSYTKDIWLAPGTYNLNIGLVIKSGSGLGTTKFEVEYENSDGTVTLQTFFPPMNIKEILPKNQFCFLKVGEFTLPQLERSCHTCTSCSKMHNQLFKVKLTMEEIGLYLKSGFSIFFIDISSPSTLFNDYDLLFYSCQETDYKFFINLPLKNFYRALNDVQNPEYSKECDQFQSDRENVLNESQKRLITDKHKEEQNDKEWSTDSELIQYSNFFYRNRYNQRNFRFNTVYQKRQFINRFGDFQSNNKNQQSPDKCAYDIYDLKWRIPILGEL